MLVSLAAVLLLISSFPVSSRLLSTPLYSMVEAYNAEKHGELPIFVPTAGIFRDALGQWWPGAQSIKRYQAAKFWSGKIYLAGGNPISGRPSEAETIFNFFPGDRDRTTVIKDGENSIQSAVELRKAVGESVTSLHLVTAPSHTLRMAAALKANSFKVVATPLGNPWNKQYSVKDFIPGIDGLIGFHSVAYEYFGIVLYLVRGDISLKDLF